MKTVIIPGYSHKNKEWAEETMKNIPDSEVYEWKHWNDPNIKFSAKAEAQNISESLSLRDKNVIGANQINIVAKSIGTLVTSILLKSVKPNKIVLCGICINDLNEDELHEYKILSDFDPNNIIVFQNSEDEHGSFEEVRKFLSQINPNIKIIEKPGSTHEYPYYDEFIDFLKQP